MFDRHGTPRYVGRELEASRSEGPGTRWTVGSVVFFIVVLLFRGTLSPGILLATCLTFTLPNNPTPCLILYEMKRFRVDNEDSKSVLGTEKQLLTLSQKNLVSGTTNKYTLDFQTTVNFGTNSEVSLAAGQMFFSWNNIGPEYGNQNISIIWIDGNTANVTIPAGQWEVTDISNYLKSVMLGLGWYLVDNNNNNQYYISIQPNSVYGKVQANLLVLPAALPVGWAYGTGSGAAWVTAAKTPQLVIPALSSAGKGISVLLGFSPGIYPPSTAYQTGTMSQTASTTLVGVGTTFTAAMVGGIVTFADGSTALVTAFTDATHVTVSVNQTQVSQATNISYNPRSTSYSTPGDLYPTLAPVNEVVVQCDLVNNPNIRGANTARIWSINGSGHSPRSTITFNIPELIWLPIIKTQTQTVTISLTDQDGNALVQTDTNSSFSLYISQPRSDVV